MSRARGPIIDAYRELQELGHFGANGVELLHELVGQEVRRFPVLLAPGATWNSDAVAEFVQEFFVDRGPAVTAALLVQVTDVASMARYLRRSVRHFLLTGVVAAVIWIATSTPVAIILGGMLVAVATFLLLLLIANR